MIPTPSQVKEWIDVLGAPTAGLIAFIVLILYREFMIHLGKGLVDVFVSWAKRQ